MMECMRFLSIHFSSLTKSFWKASLSYLYQLLPLHLVSSTDLFLSIFQIVNDNMEQYQPQY